MPRCKKRKHSESLLSCLDQTSLAVVHRLSNKLLGPSEKECLPSMTTLKRMSWSILDTIGTEINVDLSAGGSRKITVTRRWAELHLQDKCMGSIQLLSFYACCDAMDACYR